MYGSIKYTPDANKFATRYIVGHSILLHFIVSGARAIIDTSAHGQKCFMYGTFSKTCVLKNKFLKQPHSSFLTDVHISVLRIHMVVQESVAVVE